MMSMKKCKIIGIFILAFIISFPAFSEKRKLNLEGEKLDEVFTSSILPSLGAVTFAVPEDARSVRLYIKGLTSSSVNSQIDGGTKPGVATNVSRYRVKRRRVTVKGKPKIKGKLDYIDTAFLVKVLKSQADYYYKKNKTLTGSIGSSSNYKIVVVDGAKLTLYKNFQGYGILILTGQSKTRQRLVMENNAKWHGLIISDVGSDYKESPGSVITIGSKRSGGGIRPKPRPFVFLEKLKEYLPSIFISPAFAKSRLERSRPIIRPLPPIRPGPGPIPPIGNKVEVQGAIILAGAKPELQVGYAVISYSKNSLEEVNKKFSTLKFIWKNWQEKED